MSETNTADRTQTAFILVKSTPEWLAITPEERIKIARHTLQPLLDEFRNKLRLKWYDVEFYSARITDVWMIDTGEHQSYQLFCDQLRETPFWDRYFKVEEILFGEENAWAKNYGVAPFRS